MAGQPLNQMNGDNKALAHLPSGYFSKSDLKIPIELWLKVFSYFRDQHPRNKRLQDNTWSAFSLTCRGLRQIAQPLLFSRFTFSSFRKPYSGEQEHVPLEMAQYQRTMARLAFISQERIISGIEECCHLPAAFCPQRGVTVPADGECSQYEHIILDFFFECIVSKLSLRTKLQLNYIQLTPSYLGAFTREFHSANFIECTLAPEVMEVPLLPFEDLAVSTGSLPLPPVARTTFLPLPHPEHTLAFSFTMLYILLRDADDRDTRSAELHMHLCQAYYPSLHTLVLNFPPIIVSANWGTFFTAHCPTLEDLTIHGMDARSATLVPGALPHLRIFSGPLCFARLYAQGQPRMRHLMFHDIIALSETTASVYLCKELCEQLHSFDLFIGHYTVPLLEQIVRQCPKARALHLHIPMSANKLIGISKLCVTLKTLPLSPELELLSIPCEVSAKDIKSIDNIISAFSTHARESCPRLRYVNMSKRFPEFDPIESQDPETIIVFDAVEGKRLPMKAVTEIEARLDEIRKS